MLYAVLAGVLVVLHLLFVVFVTLGGLGVLRWPRLAWLHLPAATWGVLIELRGWVCPLTPLEQRLWIRAGREGYGGGFVEHYLLPVLYPSGLTRSTQIALGVAVALFNLGIYGLLIYRAAFGRGRERTGKPR